jgi:hypothetical protein
VAQGGLTNPEKEGYGVLEKHDHDDGGAPARNARGERWRRWQCGLTFTRLTQLRGGGDRGGSRQSSRRGLVDNGAVVSARELTGVEAAMAARFLRLADEIGKEEEGMDG